MKCIGIMTGNSLDAIDVVLTEFNNSSITDICAHSKNIPLALSEKFRQLKQQLADNNGNIEEIYHNNPDDFMNLHNEYVNLVAEAVNELIKKSNISKSEISAVGFHGQTCHHFPPSIAGKDNEPSTLQIGSGQMLADLINIPVVFDFRSDDIMNGGEGAPLAPMHNVHITESLKSQGIFPVAFCNGGNTGNIAIISDDINTNETKIIGWDIGPFNHFVDYLARTEAGIPYDKDGKIALSGKLNYELLDKLFASAVQTSSGRNFLLQTPPKSSDPAWYKIIPELTDTNIPLADRMHTAACFSAQIFIHSFNFIPFYIKRPKYFLLFGGGWNNPVIKKYFEDLIFQKFTLIPKISNAIKGFDISDIVIDFADKYGYSGKYMEARIFADMAKCYLEKQSFTSPDTTDCNKSVVCGQIAYPQGTNSQLWSRAANGWSKKI